MPGFLAGFEEAAPDTRASRDTVCSSESSGLACMLTVKAEPYGDLAVKCAPARSVHDRIGVSGYSSASWDNGLEPDILYDECFTCSNGIWTASGRPVPKADDGGTSRRYFAYGPYHADGFSPDFSSGRPGFRYEVPRNASSQQDIIVASSGACDPGQSRVSLSFGHILSAVSLSVDDSSSDAVIKDVCFRNVCTSGEWDFENGWRLSEDRGDFHLPVDLSVHRGTAVGVNEGDNTLMLLPQTLTGDACVVVTLVKDGREQILSAPVSGQVWAPGMAYSYILHLDLDDVSTMEIGVDMRHKALSFRVGANFYLPMFYFREGTRRIDVDWGDGTSDSYTTMQSDNEPCHNYPSGFVGVLTVKIHGASPRIDIGGSYVQYITTIDIRDNELYDSREGCNCIVDSSTGEIVYAGISYRFPSFATSLGKYSMVNIETARLTLPSSITRISGHAFGGPSHYLKNIHIPASVTSIEDAAFLNLGADVSVDASNRVYDSRRGLGCVMETATDYVVRTNKRSSIPQEAKGIRPWAMSSSPENVVLPSGCTDLMENAFRNNYGITAVSLPEACSVGDYAFHNCVKLKSIVSAGGISAGDYAFGRCGSLVSLDLGMFSKVGMGCFTDCDVMEELIVPEGFVFPMECFMRCSSLLHLTIPSGCRLGSSTFRDCKGLRSVDLHCSSSNSPTNYSYQFFGCTALTTLRIYDGFTNCSTYDFYGTSLSTIECRCHEKPTFYSIFLPRDGVFHTFTGTNYLGWMKTSGLESLGWTWQDDLVE